LPVLIAPVRRTAVQITENGVRSTLLHGVEHA